MMGGSPPVEELLRERSLIYVTGKGGSGKTTVAAALGIAVWPPLCARRSATTGRHPVVEPLLRRQRWRFQTREERFDRRCCPAVLCGRVLPQQALGAVARCSRMRHRHPIAGRIVRELDRIEDLRRR